MLANVMIVMGEGQVRGSSTTLNKRQLVSKNSYQAAASLATQVTNHIHVQHARRQPAAGVFSGTKCLIVASTRTQQNAYCKIAIEGGNH
jgi:hypothetical protein